MNDIPGKTGRRGRFVTFEGIDGSGKTTQMCLLGERLRAEGREVVETAEPGGTAVGAQIRRILLDSANRDLCATAELLLYFASRAQNVEQCILPALAEGKIVLSDRFTDSTLAYQGAGRELGEDAVLALHRIACRGLMPDLTLLIDVDVETSLARTRARWLEFGRSEQAGQTRLEDEAIGFHRRVRKAYLRMAEREPRRFRVINGGREVAAVAEAVWEAVQPLVAPGVEKHV